MPLLVKHAPKLVRSPGDHDSKLLLHVVRIHEADGSSRRQGVDQADSLSPIRIHNDGIVRAADVWLHDGDAGSTCEDYRKRPSRISLLDDLASKYPPHMARVARM